MAYFRFNTLRCLCAIVTFLVASLAAQGQTVHGTVTNGTTKKPMAGVDVLLLRPDKGMAEETRTKANARGEFTFQLPDSQFMRAVRVRHQNVNYHQALFPGATSVAVTVYESAPTVPGVRRVDESMVIQAKASQVQVYQIFNVQNDSQPPRTQQEFSFYLPEGAVVESGEAIRAGAMPLKTTPAPVEGDKNKYLFSYPLIPGQTHFELIYTLPYTGTFRFEPKFAGPVEKFYVLTPKSVQFAPVSPSAYQDDPERVAAFGLKEVDAHLTTSTANSSQLAFQIAGEGVIQEDTSQQQAGRGQPADDNRPGIGLGVPNEGANPLSSGQWGFLGVLTLFMAGGAVFLFMVSNPAKAAAAPAPAKGSATLLDALKEEMFQLEADRIHGKIATEEYNSAKAALDKTLQRAMKRATTN